MKTNIFTRQMTRLERVNLKAEEVNDNTLAYQTIGDFLSPDSQRRYIDTITAIRNLCPTLTAKRRNAYEVYKLKTQLPAGVVSGKVQNGMREQDIVERNDVACIDIDGQDNPALYDWEAVKQAVSKLPYVAYAGLSVSGLGIFALIPVADGMKHKEHFKALESDFANTTFTITQNKDMEPTVIRGIKLDPAPSNIASKRFVSYDPSPYINSCAEVYTKTYKPPTLILPRYMSSPHSGFTSYSTTGGSKFNVESFLNNHGIKYNVRERQGGLQYIVTCPWADLHSSSSSADTAIFVYPNGAVGFKCMHAHCADKQWRDYRVFYEPNAYAGRTPYRLTSPPRK